MRIGRYGRHQCNLFSTAREKERGGESEREKAAMNKRCASPLYESGRISISRRQRLPPDERNATEAAVRAG